MIYIETVDGIKHDLKSAGIIPLKFILDSPAPKHSFEEIEGRNGYIDLGTTLEGRSMKVEFLMQATDFHDYALLRAEIFNILSSQAPFYLVNTEEYAKRWKVKVAGSFTPERVSHSAGTFDISFISASSFAESIGTTQDLLSFEEDIWQIGQGLITEDLTYTFENTRFRIYNAGNVTVDPREFPLKIEFQGTSTNLEIKNITTGEKWSYTGSSSTTDSITVDGIRSLKNGSSIFKDTNKKLITIVPGWNEFEITGASAFTISFDFRFYYL